MRVVFILHYPFYGGPHNQAARLAQPLSARGWEMTVALPSERGSAADRLEAAGLSVERIPLHRLRASLNPLQNGRLLASLWGDIQRLRRVIAAARADVVLIAGLVNPHGAIAARLVGVPLVWQIVDSRTPAVVRRTVMPLVGRLADVAMFDGQGLIELHSAGRLAIPTRVYYPPVSVSAFIPSIERRVAVRRRHGIPLDAAVVGTVANITPQKGLEYFVRAAKEIFQVNRKAWFLLVGESFRSQPSYLGQLRKEIALSGVPAERFVFAGSRTDVEWYYPAMDVKLITSVPRSEGTTTTAIEAMSCGVPVVATNVGAIKEVVEDGVTGLLVAPRDPFGLATATLSILGDPSRAVSMSKSGRSRALSRFDTSVCADAHVEAFESALRRRGLLHDASLVAT